MSIQSFLSLYRPRYIRSLIYMLQTSEYDVGDFTAWYLRTRDFSSVERRRKIAWTPKATLFAVALWALVGIVAYILLTFLFLGGAFLVLLAPILLLLPFVLAVALAGFAILFAGVQSIVEQFYMRRAALRLSRMKAFKIAIAGSFGKTTMREILKAVLAESKRVAAPPHSYNTPLSISRFVGSLKGDEEVLIFELGEYYPGDVRKLCEMIKPDLGIVTGVNEAHLEKFGDLEETAETIFELADYLNDKPLYVNGESEMAWKHAPEHAIIYSCAGSGDWKAAHTKTDLSGLSFSFQREGEDIAVRSKLLGVHNVGPLSAAIHVAKRLGLPNTAIEAGLSKTKAFEHRMQARAEGGIVIIDDSYNGNPDGARAAITFLAGLSAKRRFYITPGFVEMGARSEVVHRELGRELALSGIEHIVLIQNSVTGHIESGLAGANYHGKILHFPDMPQALSALKHVTTPGDVVLIQNDWPDQYA
ncbi:MAG: UDP-N-acetylmuramoyl-tripeptide-D-alanyl-D-alanine ligase [Parcubacteria group bacterium GW2011_GWA2_51_10]|nr:MAG: UDP-N-acetylmuramoyl-tripeptide-D-alanyl-D-alanine ligase [Parcubacteria group bacterium GW2011_GWA2_51_10]